MPLFEYECRQCHHRFETLVRADTRAECPSCHSGDLERMLSVFAVSAKSGAGARESVGPCGTCGDPRGPGACSLN